MKCPCCGQRIEAMHLDMLSDLQTLAPLERKLINTLISHHPRKVSAEQLAEGMWPYGDGPDDEHTTIRVVVCRTRKKLAGTFWRIPRAAPGAGDIKRYSLERGEL